MYYDCVGVRAHSTPSDSELDTDTTEVASETSEHSCYILRTRWSRPQRVDQWRLLRPELDRGKVVDWRTARQHIAAGPLDKAPFVSAFDDMRRLASRHGGCARMIYEKGRLNEGPDSMGYRLMHNAVIRPFEVRYDPPTYVTVHALSGEVIWRKVLEGDLIYDSKMFAEEFRQAMGYRQIAFIDPRDLEIELKPPSLAVIRAICPKL